MADIPGPVTPRRQLAAELRRLREGAGLRLEQVADQLLISKSKLSRIEKGQGRPHPRDVRDLIRFYHLEGTPEAARLHQWTEAARRQPWWVRDLPTVRGRTAGFDMHVAYETEATSIRIYAIPVMPVLMQTADYARAFYRAAEHWRSEEQVEQLVALRLHRQEAFAERQPQPDVAIVIHESCLRQQVGSPAMMKAQLEAVAATPDNIDLRVLPFAAPPAYTSTCMYAYFTFDDPDRDIVSIETHAGFRQLDTEKHLADYRRHFQDLQERAMSPIETRDLIRAAANAC